MMRYDLGVGDKRNWLVGEDRFDPDHHGKGEAVFCQGNGYLGQRAALEETYVGQTRDLLVTGTFDRFDESEVTELPNLPDLTNLQLYMDGERFSMAEGRVTDYRRTLDLQTGPRQTLGEILGLQVVNLYILIQPTDRQLHSKSLPS